MTTTFNIHLDLGEETFVVWWAETPDVSGLTIAADTLPELKVLIDEAAAIHLPGRELAYLLTPNESEPSATATTEDAVQPSIGAARVLPDSRGVSVRSTIRTNFVQVAA
jgi:predicted RNase H-like HicB family nuclease